MYSVEHWIALPCGHLFHDECFFNTLQCPHKCPVCGYVIGDLNQIEAIRANDGLRLWNLLQSEEFFSCQLDVSLAAATMWGRAPLVRMLIDGFGISLVGIEKALSIAEMRGDTNVKALLSAAYVIRTNDAQDALLCAVRNNLHTTVMKFISHPGVTPATIDKALWEALHSRSYESFCSLFADKRSTIENKRNVMAYAADHGLMRGFLSFFVQPESSFDADC
jgi:hypothetical protein